MTTTTTPTDTRYEILYTDANGVIRAVCPGVTYATLIDAEEALAVWLDDDGDISLRIEGVR